MKPSIAFTVHDDTGRGLSLLGDIDRDLKSYFSEAFIVTTPITNINYPEKARLLEKDPFYHVFKAPQKSIIGKHKKLCWSKAAELSKASIIHLTDLDRLSYAILKHNKAYTKSLLGISNIQKPLFFDRSEKAWKTHPINYRAIESSVRELAKVLFNKDLDFGWCYLVVSRSSLRKVVPKLRSDELYVYGELIYWLRDTIVYKKVDWLAWEDPFFLGKDPKIIKKQRETDNRENEKRLGYVIPTIKFLLKKWQQSQR